MIFISGTKFNYVVDTTGKRGNTHQYLVGIDKEAVAEVNEAGQDYANDEDVENIEDPRDMLMDMLVGKGSDNSDRGEGFWSNSMERFPNQKWQTWETFRT